MGLPCNLALTKMIQRDYFLAFGPETRLSSLFIQHFQPHILAPR
jgi:hypothetical protein